MKTIRLRIKPEVKKDISLLNLMVILYLCKHCCTNFATAIGFSTSITAGVILVSFLIVFTVYFITNPSEIKWDGIGLIAVCALFFILTIKIHPEYSARFDDVYNDGRFSAASVFSLSAGIYTYYIFRMYGDNVEQIYRAYRIVPYILFFMNLPTFINRRFAYAMDFGYEMELAAILFLMHYLFKEHKKSELILSLISILLSLLYGSRASILGYLVFIILYLIWQNRITIGRIFFLGLGLIGAIVYNSRTIMMFIYNFFVSLGLSSRTLYLIASGDIMGESSARQDKIWPVLIELIQNSSFFKMYGAYGDRYYLASYYPYAHNIILEILVTFGKCLGGIILILIAVHFIRTCVRNKEEGGVLTLAFGSFALCRLMVSSSFWHEPYFWVFLALMVNCNILYKKDRFLHSYTEKTEEK